MKIFIKQTQSPGDIIMLTAAIRDLKNSHPYLKLNVRCCAPELWRNNPHLSREVSENNADRVIDLKYPLINDKPPALPLYTCVPQRIAAAFRA